jgi:hypothetical protein
MRIRARTVFLAVAALRNKDIVIPPAKDGYASDLAEDIGYADAYTLAFRPHRFSANS